MRSSYFARRPKGTIVMFQLVDGAASLCRMRMLRLRGDVDRTRADRAAQHACYQTVVASFFEAFASRDEPDTLSLAAADASGPSSAADGRSDDNHCDRDSDELCLLGIGPLRGGLSLAIRRDTLGNAAAPARRPAKNFRLALAAS